MTRGLSTEIRSGLDLSRSAAAVSPRSMVGHEFVADDFAGALHGQRHQHIFPHRAGMAERRMTLHRKGSRAVGNLEGRLREGNSGNLFFLRCQWNAPNSERL